MDQMSFGTRSLVAIAAKVILTKPGGWLCIEEPETYLHPKAQLGLFLFLREESKTKRIFVATHSTSIAAGCPLASLFIVQRDAENCTTATPVTETEAYDVIEQLGVKPSFSFEADAIVFVEDEESIPIYEAWAKKFGFKIKLQFLDTEGACTLSYYANSRIAMSKFVHTLVFAVFGSGAAAIDEQSTYQKIIRQLELPPDQVVTLDCPHIEDYLLDPKAILKAFPAISLPEPDLQARLAVAETGKKTLRKLFAEFKISQFEGCFGAAIAQAMENIPAPVLELFQRINISSKPFWKI
jgi:hypothetical protein